MSRKVSEVNAMPTAVIVAPHIIGFLGPYFWRSFSPTRIVADDRDEIPNVSMPASSDDHPAAALHEPERDHERPGRAVEEEVRQGGSRERLVVEEAQIDERAQPAGLDPEERHDEHGRKATSRPSEAPENQPSFGPCEMNTLIASIAATNVSKPGQSKPWPVASGTPGRRRVLGSGSSDSTPTTIEMTKIERHPKNDAAIKPPKRAQNPEPPHEPIDQNDTARLRCAPS